MVAEEKHGSSITTVDLPEWFKHRAKLESYWFESVAVSKPWAILSTGSWSTNLTGNRASRFHYEASSVTREPTDHWLH